MDHVVALFCGAGGMSLGCKRAGITPIFAADIDKAACNTYSANLKTVAHNLDLGSDDTAVIQKHLAPFRNPLAVVGGPPCQGFSTAGARKPDDPRNRLVFQYLDIVEYLNPRWFVFENVEGILTADGGESVYALLKCFIERGYTVRIEKVNFAAYGLPQSRKRVLIVGNHLGADFRFPPETNSFSSGKHRSLRPLPCSPSVMEAFGDLPACRDVEGRISYVDETRPSEYGLAMRHGNDRQSVVHHFAASNSVDQERIRLLKPGQTMRNLPEEHWHPSFRRRAYRRVKDGTPTERRGGPPSGVKRLCGDDCSLTITSAASREFIHPIEDRPLTLREAARLQSFPDSFEFDGTYSQISTQIGNAVPPLAGEVLARHIVSLDGAFGAQHIIKRPLPPGLLGFHLTDSSGMSPALQRTQLLLKSLPIVGREAKQLLWQPEDATTALPSNNRH